MGGPQIISIQLQFKEMLILTKKISQVVNNVFQQFKIQYGFDKDNFKIVTDVMITS